MTNPERDQDRVHDLFDHFKRFGVTLFKEDRAIYERLADILEGQEVLEAGCGFGTGSYILSTQVMSIIATDKLEINVKFAEQLYPRMRFRTWDISKGPFGGETFNYVVAVEVLEHVKDDAAAARNLIASARKEVWISTPNRLRSPETTPSNPFHVREYSPEEVITLFAPHKVDVFRWDTFEKVPLDTTVSPLVYRILV